MGVGQEIFYVDGVASGSATGTYQPSLTNRRLAPRRSTGAKHTGGAKNSVLLGKVDEVRVDNPTLSGP